MAYTPISSHGAALLVVLALKILNIFAQNGNTGEIQIRLSGSNSHFAGRVEVLYNGVWGTVCNDGWDITDAVVVCRSLGYPSAISVSQNFGPGTGPIFLSEIDCNGDELRLEQCRHTGWGETDCSHDQDAGTLCLYENSDVLYENSDGSSSAPASSDNLNDSTSESVTDPSIENSNDLSSTYVSSGNSYVSTSESLSEPPIENSENSSSVYSSSENSYASISYEYSDRSSSENSDKLPFETLSSSSSENVPESPFKNSEESFSGNSASSSSETLADSSSETSTDSFSESTDGSSYESSDNWSYEYYFSSGSVFEEEREKKQTLRLSDGTAYSMGRVEIFVNGEWGTVCNDGWHLQAAQVACHYLGYLSAISAYPQGIIPGSGPIHIETVQCVGDELRLDDCYQPDLGDDYCDHSSDASAHCSTDGIEIFFPPENETVYQLVGGASPKEGILQFHTTENNKWSTLCTAGRTMPAGVGADICRRLGYPFFCGSRTGVSIHNDLDASPFVRAADYCMSVSAGYFFCGLLPVKGNTTTCTADEAIWISCGNDSDVDFRLSHNMLDNAGLLQVRCHDTEQWGSVCGDDWIVSTEVHRVACRHLGFPDSAVPTPYTVENSKLSSWVPTLIKGIVCSGEEEALTDCEITQPTLEFCPRYAGVRCGNESDRNLELKLIDSRFPASGIVVGRVRQTDEWGALCQDLDDSRDTDVLCRHFGFSTSVPVQRSSRKESTGLMTMPTLVSHIGCLGMESDFSQCLVVSDTDKTCEYFQYIECQDKTSRFDIPAYLCGEIHYCGFECNTGLRNTLRIYKEETCKCDDACMYFNDCCYDYQSQCQTGVDTREITIKGISLKYHTCVHLPTKYPEGRYQFFGFVLVGICPEWWINNVVRQQCEQTAAEDDIINLLPLYNEDGVVFKNIFCAVCHGMNPTVLERWKIAQNETDPMATLYSDDDVTSDYDKPKYWIEPPGETDPGQARTCPVKTVTKCLEDLATPSLDTACRKYFAPVYVNATQFKNPQCAMCNGLSVEPRDSCGNICTTTCGDGDLEPCELKCSVRGDSGNSIETLFDFGWGGDEGSVCQPGELYDTFLDRCRTVFCFPGVENEDGGCPRVAESRNFDAIPSPDRLPLLNGGCNALVNTDFGANTEYWQVVVISGPDAGVTQSAFDLSILITRFETTAIVSGDLFAMFGNLSETLEVCDVNTVTVYSREEALLLEQVNSCVNSTVTVSEVFNLTANSTSGHDFKILQAFCWTKGVSNFSRNALIPEACFDFLELECSEILMLNPEEYEVHQASVIRHVPTQKEFMSGNYAIFADGKAVICGPVDWTDPYDFALWMVSLVCSFLSLVALAATFITYCVLRELRNMGGLYTMNLVVALFVAILLLVLAGFLDIKGPGCIATSSLIHFAWLSAFFWMTLLSYSVAKTFVSKTATSRGSVCSLRWLVASMALVWGSAMLIVVVCLVLSVCKCTSLPPIYSQSPPCAIARGNVLLVVFGCPVATSLVISIVCFALVAYNVRMTKRDSKMVQSKGQLKEITDEAKIYVKLVFIFGLTWIVAFVSEAVNHVVMSYINVILNTSQGVFIFLAFGINQRVRALWRKKLPCEAGKTKSGASCSRPKVTNVQASHAKQLGLVRLRGQTSQSFRPYFEKRTASFI